VEVAKTAAAEGLARVPLTDVGKHVQEAMWQPIYPQIQVKREVRV
jgi:malate dehydrogenase (oxaloacetate-decarboxylating)